MTGRPPASTRPRPQLPRRTWLGAMLASTAGVVVAFTNGCAGAAIVPSLAITGRTSRLGAESGNQVDHAVEIALVNTSRQRAVHGLDDANPPSWRDTPSDRLPARACAHVWVCAWERTQVARALVAMEVAR